MRIFYVVYNVFKIMTLHITSETIESKVSEVVPVCASVVQHVKWWAIQLTALNVS